MRFRRRNKKDQLIDSLETVTDEVRRRLPRIPLQQAGLGIGVGRIALGSAFLAKPVLSVKVIGLDTGTATRVTWLARMAAIRDATLGAGTVAAYLGRSGQTSWLLAGAVSDVVDGIVIGHAAKEKRLDPARGFLGAGLAFGSAALASAVAWDSFRHRG